MRELRAAAEGFQSCFYLWKKLGIGCYRRYLQTMDRELWMVNAAVSTPGRIASRECRLNGSRETTEGLRQGIKAV